MKKVFSCLILACVLFVSLPNDSRAYFTTEQKSFTGTGSAGLFVVEYRFGHGKYDLYLPIAATHNQENHPTAVSFRIHNSNDDAVTGTALGLVLSDARVEDGMYFIPKGTAANFRLVMFYTPDPLAPAAPYYAQVTHLPFSFDKSQQLKLNDSELKTYQTKPVVLGLP